MPDRNDPETPAWWLFRGTGEPLDPTERDARWPAPPRWRRFDGGPVNPPPPQEDVDVGRRLGDAAGPTHLDPEVIEMVNAAVYLRRPLLVTGRPGSGKSTLAYQITHELRLGRVLRWPITTRTTLKAGLWDYDAIGRVYASQQRPAGSEAEPDIGEFIHLGPLGTALLPYRLPRVLLVDELDKSDIDLPNDLLNVFEDGEFSVSELVRVRNRTPSVHVHTADPGGTATVRAGQVRCQEFPVVIITSNDEREFPAAFKRRCLQLRLPDPGPERLAAMVAAHFPQGDGDNQRLLDAFLTRRGQVDGLAVDQLLNAVHLRTAGAFDSAGGDDWQALAESLWHRLAPGGPG